MERFSDRIGVTATPTVLQVESMDEPLGNSIWNLIHGFFDGRWESVAKLVAVHFRKFQVDELPSRPRECREWLKEYFVELEWYDVYNLLEFLVVNHHLITKQTEPSSSFYKREHEHMLQTINRILARERSGFRFVSGILSPISNPAEVAAIESAIAHAAREGLNGAHQHLRSALQLLGKKPHPDYRNATKEAISAVESVVKQMSGVASAGLDGALDALGKKVEIHGALKAGFRALYGYSSDESGIRHAILDQPNVGFDEAKFMVVSCSAFIFFLISKADAAGLLARER
jgi:hypothetical protein